jgi:gliding motility-associated lipoprotein GldH
MIAVSCSNRISEYQEFVKFDDGKWDRTDTVVFHYESPSGGLKNLYFYLENTDEYPYANIFIIAKTKRQNKWIVDTLEYEMTDGHGRWLGKKVRHTVENLLVYKTNVKTEKNEKIELHLEPATRRIDRIEGDVFLPGIVRVGLIVESKNKTE